jgi:hypothetical protein
VQALRDASERLALRRADSIDANVALPRGIQRRWPTMPLEQRRQALRAGFDALFVSPEPGAIEERVWICEHGEAPKRLPYPRHQLPPRPYAFPHNQRLVARQRRRMLAARRYGWTDAEIEQRLDDARRPRRLPLVR